VASAYIDVGIVFIGATLLALLAHFLKQPLILGYMAAGLVLGPNALGIVSDHATIAFLAELGIAMLLFIVGLELDIRKLRDLGGVVFAAGIGQVVFTTIFGYLLAAVLGFTPLVAAIISIALTFSSTAIVVKLYADRNELETLHGRIALGILLVQDFVAVLLLAFLPSLDAQAGLPGIGTILSFLKGLGLLIATFLLSKLVLRPFFRAAARSTELLFVAAISWLFLYIIAAHAFSFSIAIGAFLAGASLASLPYSSEIRNKTKPLRDFFVTVFFIGLGMQLGISHIGDVIVPAAVLSLFVLIGNPLIVMAIMFLFGFKAKTSFLASVAVAQISEFSIVFMVLAQRLGLVDERMVALTAFVAMVTITASTYGIMNGSKLYKRLAQTLKPFERLALRRIKVRAPAAWHHYRTILLGCNRMGHAIKDVLVNEGHTPLVVDLDPEVVARVSKEGLPALYGDASDPETLDELDLQHTQLVISTIPNAEDSRLLVDKIRASNRRACIICTANSPEQALGLYKSGADYVIVPRELSGAHISLLLQNVGLNRRELRRFAQDQRQSLKRSVMFG
jgi:Kef-type K+ transport system membrane component KefB/Trk K+ transport system NAD-binding subunit